MFKKIQKKRISMKTRHLRGERAERAGKASARTGQKWEVSRVQKVRGRFLHMLIQIKLFTCDRRHCRAWN